MSTARQRLPARRQSSAFMFEHHGISYRAQISRFRDGRIGEIFIDGPKVGSAAQIAGHDGAVAASLALQHGCTVQTLRHALQKLTDGRSAGPLGVALDLIEGGVNE